MWLNRLTIEKLDNGKFAVRVVRKRNTKTGVERQRLTPRLSWVKAVEAELIEPFIICKEIRQ